MSQKQTIKTRKKDSETFELRIRDGDPVVFRKLQELAIRFKAPTLVQAFYSTVNRYDGMQKRVEEQNAEIAELSRKLKRFERLEMSVVAECRNLSFELSQHAKSILQYKNDVDAHLKDAGHGTKTLKSLAGRPASGRKTFPSKKTTSPRKTRKK